MSREYLDRLPPALQSQGSVSRGEIELRSADPGETLVGIVYEDDRLLVIRDPVIFPGGVRGTYLRVVEKAQLSGSSGTIIVPWTSSGLFFVHIYRHALREWAWELPRGYQEPNLSSIENAIKECKEEIGVEPEEVQLVGEVTPNSGILAGKAHVYSARLADAAEEQLVGQDEESISEVRLVPWEQLDEFLLHNVRCGFSLSAVLLTKLNGHLPVT